MSADPAIPMPQAESLLQATAQHAARVSVADDSILAWVEDPPVDEGSTPCTEHMPEKRQPPRTAADLHAALWRASEIGTMVNRTLATGWETLDRELPGGGWPMQAITEVLSPQPGVLEWRLLAPTLRLIRDGQVIVVGPPKVPHLPGLLQGGLDQRRLVWIKADAPAERLWVTEQIIRANAAGAVLAWLPQARQDQLRRLQVSAQSCDCPVFLLRPQAARHEASPAPLRVHADLSVDWALQALNDTQTPPPIDR